MHTIITVVATIVITTVIAVTTTIKSCFIIIASKTKPADDWAAEAASSLSTLPVEASACISSKPGHTD